MQWFEKSSFQIEHFASKQMLGSKKQMAIVENQSYVRSSITKANTTQK